MTTRRYNICHRELAIDAFDDDRRQNPRGGCRACLANLRARRANRRLQEEPIENNLSPVQRMNPQEPHQLLTIWRAFITNQESWTSHYLGEMNVTCSACGAKYWEAEKSLRQSATIQSFEK
ncbi:hypothetical protein L873DRAFT_365467 [Choiromyces venosus 120613-1]|uniref:Uncharacterized protein n=1 Tax=Choiromyces venosus 120613-1 TaxID=1336337 RepID=A0A3N4K0C6_9PEZI|nr:hypothetical protein L873DRAFT_365467 [Choiromyces venosus 120613-1]